MESLISSLIRYK